jgi:uncharacterized membrane protein (TIGR02234 family)
MAEPRTDRRDLLLIRFAQLLLVVAAGALWIASRLPWVIIRSFDGLGPPKTATLSGGSWSTALLPLTLLLLATAVAALAVRGWPLRVLAVLVAAGSFAVGYLAISLWAVPDVAVRGADLADVPVRSLVGSERHYSGAVVALVAAVGALVAAVLLIRSASMCGSGSSTKYAAPAARESTARRAVDRLAVDAVSSERMIWDALDVGRDPTDRPRQPAQPPDRRQRLESDTEGR